MRFVSVIGHPLLIIWRIWRLMPREWDKFPCFWCHFQGVFHNTSVPLGVFFFLTHTRHGIWRWWKLSTKTNRHFATTVDVPKNPKKTNHWVTWDGANKKMWYSEHYWLIQTKPDENKGAIHYILQPWSGACTHWHSPISFRNRSCTNLEFLNGWKTWWWTIIESEKKHL